MTPIALTPIATELHDKSDPPRSHTCTSSSCCCCTPCTVPNAHAWHRVPTWYCQLEVIPCTRQWSPRSILLHTTLLHTSLLIPETSSLAGIEAPQNQSGSAFTQSLHFKCTTTTRTCCIGDAVQSWLFRKLEGTGNHQDSQGVSREPRRRNTLRCSAPYAIHGV